MFIVDICSLSTVHFILLKEQYVEICLKESKVIGVIVIQNYTVELSHFYVCFVFP